MEVLSKRDLYVLIHQWKNGCQHSLPSSLLWETAWELHCNQPLPGVHIDMRLNCTNKLIFFFLKCQFFIIVTLETSSNMRMFLCLHCLAHRDQAHSVAGRLVQRQSSMFSFRRWHWAQKFLGFSLFCMFIHTPLCMDQALSLLSNWKGISLNYVASAMNFVQWSLPLL
jgi:hypothetical protein